MNVSTWFAVIACVVLCLISNVYFLNRAWQLQEELAQMDALAKKMQWESDSQAVLLERLVELRNQALQISILDTFGPRLFLSRVPAAQRTIAHDQDLRDLEIYHRWLCQNLQLQYAELLQQHKQQLSPSADPKGGAESNPDPKDFFVMYQSALRRVRSPPPISPQQQRSLGRGSHVARSLLNSLVSLTPSDPLWEELTSFLPISEG